jgi:thiol-disulfide isomerase/thioredoxin
MSTKSDKIVVVFHADDCHFCHDYLPRFRRVAVKYRAFVAIKSVKLTDKNMELLNRYKIGGFPSTCILAADESLIKKVEGAIDEKAIEKLFEKACS